MCNAQTIDQECQYIIVKGNNENKKEKKKVRKCVIETIRQKPKACFLKKWVSILDEFTAHMLLSDWARIAQNQPKNI